jgi:hypothetical protein
MPKPLRFFLRPPLGGRPPTSGAPSGPPPCSVPFAYLLSAPAPSGPASARRPSPLRRSRARLSSSSCTASLPGFLLVDCAGASSVGTSWSSTARWGSSSAASLFATFGPWDFLARFVRSRRFFDFCRCAWWLRGLYCVWSPSLLGASRLAPPPPRGCCGVLGLAWHDGAVSVRSPVFALAQHMHLRCARRKRASKTKNKKHTQHLRDQHAHAAHFAGGLTIASSSLDDVAHGCFRCKLGLAGPSGGLGRFLIQRKTQHMEAPGPATPRHSPERPEKGSISCGSIVEQHRIARRLFCFARIVNNYSLLASVI